MGNNDGEEVTVPRPNEDDTTTGEQYDISNINIGHFPSIGKHQPVLPDVGQVWVFWSNSNRDLRFRSWHFMSAGRIRSLVTQSQVV